MCFSTERSLTPTDIYIYIYSFPRKQDETEEVEKIDVFRQGNVISEVGSFCQVRMGAESGLGKEVGVQVWKAVLGFPCKGILTCSLRKVHK